MSDVSSSELLAQMIQELATAIKDVLSKLDREEDEHVQIQTRVHDVGHMLANFKNNFDSYTKLEEKFSNPAWITRHAIDALVAENIPWDRKRLVELRGCLEEALNEVKRRLSSPGT